MPMAIIITTDLLHRRVLQQRHQPVSQEALQHRRVPRQRHQPVSQKDLQHRRVLQQPHQPVSQKELQHRRVPHHRILLSHHQAVHPDQWDHLVLREGEAEAEAEGGNYS